MTSDYELKFQEILSKNKFHVTKQRLETFRLLSHSEPQSMRNILAKANGHLDRVSVYRSIVLFEKLGIVRRLYIGWKYKIELSDDFLTHHHHISCLACGKTLDIEDEAHIETFIEHVSKKFNFNVTRHQFELEGYCSACDKST